MCLTIDFSSSIFGSWQLQPQIDRQPQGAKNGKNNAPENEAPSNEGCKESRSELCAALHEI